MPPRGTGPAKTVEPPSTPRSLERARGAAAPRAAIDASAGELGRLRSLLVGFVDAIDQERLLAAPLTPGDHSRIAALEHELSATQIDPRGAVRDLEISNEAQKAANAALTAVNTELQETLERQRTTADDLRNILYSSDVATLFLDAELKIRVFTPAIRSIFSILPSDIGRPLADLHALTANDDLPADALSVLRNSTPVDREIEAPNGVWFCRRMAPCRAPDDTVEGLVITFTDITERKRAAKALVDARLEAELATAAKSRFLAIASHDLRQPLQSLAFLQGLLAKAVTADRAKDLVAKLDQTLGAMSGMLNTLLDINQIEAGVVRPEIVTFAIVDILDRLRDEFTYQARAQSLNLTVVACGLSIRSDPRLFEQMMRNLISNALKYTRTGRVLIGCRRRDGRLSVEVWDTGIGIAQTNLDAIFHEYHQVDNDARERSRGLGLGLSIVQRLGDLLGHGVRVRSRVGKGSVFAIEVASPSKTAAETSHPIPSVPLDPAVDQVRKGKVLVIEDDPEVQDLLKVLLNGAGHRVATARDGPGALDFVAKGALRPDVILADYNLPNGMTGLEAIETIRSTLQHGIPAIILTGDISAETLRQVALHDCVQLNKPVKLPKLARLIQDMLPTPRSGMPAAGWDAEASLDRGRPTIFVVDDSPLVRDSLRAVLEDDGRTVKDFASSEAFLEAHDSAVEGCLVIDAYLPGISGMDLLRRLRAQGRPMPAIMITGASDVTIAVEAMKAGAVDFIEKPIGVSDLLASVDRALEQSRDASQQHAWRADAAHLVDGLTRRQHEIMDLVLAGHPSKNIAADLGISQRTVETHRASIMKKTGSKSLPALARMALAASASAGREPQAEDPSPTG